MKILCLLALLGNIFLLTWEYRNGAFTAHKENLGQHAIKGKEKIFLVHELKKEMHSLSPKMNQETQMEARRPESQIKEMHDNRIAHTNTTTTKQAESSEVQLP